MIYIINYHHLFIISEEECKCAQVRNTKPRMIKIIYPTQDKKMHQKRNASAQVCKHKAAHDLKKNDIAHTLFIINIQIRKLRVCTS